MDNDKNVRNDYGEAVKSPDRTGVTTGLILFALLGSSEGATKSEALLEKSVGRVILESDRYPAGGAPVSDAIEREYRAVQALPTSQRVRFFWSVLMNVRVDAGYSVDLVELIARDCPLEFDRELKAFLERDWEGGPPQPQADIATKTLKSLQLIRVRKQTPQR